MPSVLRDMVNRRINIRRDVELIGFIWVLWYVLFGMKRTALDAKDRSDDISLEFDVLLEETKLLGFVQIHRIPVKEGGDAQVDFHIPETRPFGVAIAATSACRHAIEVPIMLTTRCTACLAHQEHILNVFIGEDKVFQQICALQRAAIRSPDVHFPNIFYTARMNQCLSPSPLIKDDDAEVEGRKGVILHVVV